MVHCHTVHLPIGALLSPCTMCGTGGLAPSLAALAAQVLVLAPPPCEGLGDATSSGAVIYL